MFNIKLDPNVTLSNLMDMNIFTAKAAYTPNGDARVFLIYAGVDAITTNIPADHITVNINSGVPTAGYIQGDINNISLYIAEQQYNTYNSIMEEFANNNIRAISIQII